MKKEELHKIINENFTPAYYVDQERKIKNWNQEALKLSGYKFDHVKDKFCYDNILQHINSEGVNLCQNGCPLHKTLEDGKVREAQVFLHHKKGHRMPVKVRTVPVKNNGGVIGAVEYFIDNKTEPNFDTEITELKNKNFIDHLTGASNRHHLEYVLKKIISEKVFEEQNIAFCFFDIDNFKLINDNYGHLVGDQALKMTVKTIKANLRPADKIFRWGGDEFALLLFNIDSKRDLKKIIKRLLIFINKSYFMIEDKTKVSITTSWGASLIKETDEYKKLLKRVDSLMYRSKNNGKNKVSLG
ncbi:sensor domain-containing diguanylate cyclase [Halanaerobium sp. ST460_2HS_T2]|jgi:diguanylate cyclase (GGDEF)-like protein/PAS domain S-box-containing protein|uniref:sensor domain-containing diguanylate cyclase n=1 Tax=Halanaerobium sp. ST460_2HS_T2 TaxID=2183914 RepID=UPI000E0324A9|nr:sensor domain-containing diguanylate cyclase [Halanaerobium sp. ST460_2HS_T2]RCW52997.1 PAS domain S-box-containing protein/diguanylate cyclase (GGDEF)-like protein [Halanaerobium sp. ST460_2HS_T2]